MSDQIKDRKQDHIQLAFESATAIHSLDSRFEYDPLHSIHPRLDDTWPIEFGTFQLKFPIWISSMTGGTTHAKNINQHLSRACGQFGLGMGLGSCRKLIEQPELIDDFDVKKNMPHQPLYANIGVAQLANYFFEKKSSLIINLLDRLYADGLIIHINPMQEWMQEEGDRYTEPPIVTIKKAIDDFRFPIIVKEVGQGMGFDALAALMELPLQAIEFGAYGGTNFTKLESLRNTNKITPDQLALCHIGHDANQMIDYCNAICQAKNINPNFRLIISGGVHNAVDAYYYLCRSKIPSIYGQASTMLKYAIESYESLEKYITQQTQNLLMAKSFLKIKNQQ